MDWSICTARQSSDWPDAVLLEQRQQLDELAGHDAVCNAHAEGCLKQAGQMVDGTLMDGGQSLQCDTSSSAAERALASGHSGRSCSAELSP